eukprot:1762010-Pleurochrysis_carterae.AAC.4
MRAVRKPSRATCIWTRAVYEATSRPPAAETPSTTRQCAETPVKLTPSSAHVAYYVTDSLSDPRSGIPSSCHRKREAGKRRRARRQATR